MKLMLINKIKVYVLKGRKNTFKFIMKVIMCRHVYYVRVITV